MRSFVDIVDSTLKLGEAPRSEKSKYKLKYHRGRTVAIGAMSGSSLIGTTTNMAITSDTGDIEVHRMHGVSLLCLTLYDVAI